MFREKGRDLEILNAGVASLSRSPYPEYHSSLDDFSIMSEESLNEALQVLLKMVEYLESCTFVFKKFQGTLCLSNPKYDLYVDPGRPELGTVAPESQQKMRHLMELIPTLREPVSVQYLSERTGVREKDVMAYLEKWEKKGLLDLR